jgi:hypothetical protein
MILCKISKTIAYLTGLVTFYGLHVFNENLEMLRRQFFKRVAVLQEPNLAGFVELPAVTGLTGLQS